MDQNEAPASQMSRPSTGSVGSTTSVVLTASIGSTASIVAIVAVVSMALLPLGLVALFGCAPSPLDSESESKKAAASPARLTIELTGTPPVSNGYGSLKLKIGSLTLMPAAGAGHWWRVGSHESRRPAFVFALKKGAIRLESDPEVIAREIRVVPGRYRTLNLQLAAGSTLTDGARILPVSGGGSIPVEVDLFPGAEATLAIKLDSDRSLRRAPDGTVRFDPVVKSASLSPGSVEPRGSIRGRVMPADAGAIIVIYDSDGSPSPSIAFPDPHSGDFALEELPIGDYRVEVNPLQPAFEARVFQGVTVPWDGHLDLGAIDLRPKAPSNGSARGTEVDSRPTDP